MRILLLFSGLLNIGALAWYLYTGIMSDPELANKQEWSILQYLEGKYRNAPAQPDVIIVKNHSDTGYDAAGFVDKETNKRIWILTNSRIAPRIKLMPELKEIVLSDQQTQSILDGLKVNDEVRYFLTIKRR